MQFTAGEVAQKIGAVLSGDPNLVLTGIAPVEEARPGDLAFIANKKYTKYLDTTEASAVIVAPGYQSSRVALLTHPSPYFGFMLAMRLFYEGLGSYAPGIHSTALIGERCRIAPSAQVGPFVVIEDDVEIGERTRIQAQVFIGRDTRIGAGCLIYANVTLRERTALGDRVIIHSGTTLGSDGFGYAQADGVHHKIPQVGRVIVEDDVEIGANCAVDRATLGETRMDRGTKIDNLVQIAHNVKTGENCLLISQVGISGSTRLGKNVILAGQVGLVGHLEIGDNVVVGAQSGVPGSIEAGQTVLGSPAREIMHQKRIEAILNHLPDYIRRLRALEKKLADK